MDLVHKEIASSKQFKVEEKENRVTTYTFTIDKIHSDFIRPWDPEFTCDKPVYLITNSTTEEIKLTDHIQLDFYQQTSLAELEAVIDKEIENMNKVSGPETTFRKGGGQKILTTKEKKNLKKIGPEEQLTAIKFWESGVSDQVICKAMNIKLDQLKYLKRKAKHKDTNKEKSIEENNEKNKRENKDDREEKEVQLAAIKLHESGMVHKYICEALNIKISELSYWISLYKTGNIDRLESRRKPKMKRKTDRKYTRIIKEEYINDIHNYFRGPHIPCATTADIKNYLAGLHPGKLENASLSIVRGWVKKAGCLDKKLSSSVPPKNSLPMIKLRHTVARILCQNLQKAREIIFIDEVSFNKNIKSICGYFEVDGKASAAKRDIGDNYTVIAAMTKTKFLGFQIFRGGASASGFGFFLISLLKNYSEIVEKRNDYALFIDKTVLHQSKATKGLLKQFNVCYNAPRSPMLNPITMLFSTWKDNFRTLTSTSNNDNNNTVNVICLSSKIIKTEKLAEYYVHSLGYIRQSLLKQIID